MANTTETVFVEFVVDGKQLETATDTLQRTGQIDKTSADQFKKTNAELAKRQQTINALSKQLKDVQSQNAKTIADLQAKTEAYITDFVTGFGEGVTDTLKEAGLEFDEFGKVMNNGTQATIKSSGTLKSQLNGMRQALAQLKSEGKDDTEQFLQLAKQAAKLENAIKNANQAVNHFGSNTQSIDGVISIMKTAASGFAVVEGAAGLFGKENEELNETLIKVSSSLALLQGLQEISATLQEESAASVFIETAAQKLYNLVIGESIGLMAAFRVALAATGVGLIIVGIVALAQALKKANKETEEANNLIDRNKELIDADTEAIKRVTEEQIARAEAIKLKESEIIVLRGHGLVLQRNAIIEANALLATQRAELDNTSEAYFKLNRQIEDNNQQVKNIDSQIIIEQINLQKQLRTEQLQGIVDTLQAQLDGATKNSKNELSLAKQTARAKAAVDLNEAGDNLPKRLAIEADLAKQIRELDLQFAIVRQNDRIAQTERALLNAQQRSKQINERTNQEEIDVQKQLVREKARLELLQEGLTQNQRKNIIEQALNEQLQLQKDFNNQSAKESLDDLISRNNADLSNIKLTDKEKLSLQEENLIIAAQIEIDANHGLVDKIKEIRGKLEEDLRALRLAALQKQLADELSLEASRTGALRRSSERIAANENKGLKVRLNAINQVAALDIANINAREDALDESLRKGLISQQDYNVQFAALKDEELKVTEDTEVKKRQLIKETQKNTILFALDTAKQVVDIIAQFGQQQTEARQQDIDAQRQQISDLKDAGAITEKEATARQKKLDQEERSLKRKQAERDKAVALFNAVINTAAAITKALPNVVLVGIAAAIGAAQIALIASKPIPKFAKGKKDSYEGYGEIGEAGAELMQRENGDMYIAKKKAIVYIGKRDKVFNARETAEMLEKNSMRPYIVKDQQKEYRSIYNNQIDYDKLGKVISSNLPQVGLNINEHGFVEYMKYQNGIVNYINNRRSYK